MCNNIVMLIGITGKTASGKNYVSEILEKRGWIVLDLDKICHNLYETKEKELVLAFGTAERALISRIVFDNPKQLKELEDILYPAVLKIIRDTRSEAEKVDKVLAVNGSLLHRAELDSECDYIIYVDSAYNERLERAKKRDNITKERFDARNSAQKDVDFRDVKYRCPVLVVDNNSFQLKGLDEAVSTIESSLQNAR